MRQFDDELAFLVLLARFERVFVFPAERGLAALAEDVGDGVQSGEQDPLLGRTASHVHHRIEEVSATLAALERLGNEFVVIGQMSATVDAGISAVTVGQVGLERLDHPAAHFHGAALVHRRVARRMDALEPGGVLSVSHESFLIDLVVMSRAADPQHAANPLASRTSHALRLTPAE